MHLVITTSRYDEVTEYLAHYSKELINYSEANGHKPIHLKKPRLTKEELSNIVKKKNPKLFLFNAHGDENTIYGDKINGKVAGLIIENENHYLLCDKLVYARACSAGASLGKACTEKNNGCFIGYKDPFKFIIDVNWLTNPSKDNAAKVSLEPSNELAKHLIKGGTAQEAVKRFVELSKKNLSKLTNKLRNKKDGAFHQMMVLWDNLEATVVLGNPNLAFKP